MNTSQHQKVIELCAGERWVCQNEFRAAFIFSPHKRRVEIEGRKNRNEPVQGKYEFLERKCEHGIRGQKDYKMIENPNYLTEKESMYALPTAYKSLRKVKIKIPSAVAAQLVNETVARLNAIPPFKESKKVETSQQLF